MFSLLRDVIEILQSLGTFSVIKQNWSSNFDLRNLFSDILVIDISPSFGIIILIEMLANMVYVYCAKQSMCRLGTIMMFSSFSEYGIYILPIFQVYCLCCMLRNIIILVNVFVMKSKAQKHYLREP